MFPTAHVASALLFNRLTRLDAGVVPAVLGALVPDTIDKTLAWIFHVIPSARHIGHTPFTAVLVSIGVSASLGRSKGVAFGTAYIIHLVCDLWHAGHVPLLMPFKKYSRQSQRWRVELSPEAVLLEAIGAVVILLLLRRPASDERFDMELDTASAAERRGVWASLFGNGRMGRSR